MNQEWIEISSFQGEGYQSVVDYEEWRVAILNYCEELEVRNIRTMQKHEQTDEVFVLLKGKCKLYVAGKDQVISKITAVDMEPFQLYNIKKGVWHSHTLSKEGSVLIIENRNTGDDNSPIVMLTEEQREELYKL